MRRVRFAGEPAPVRPPVTHDAWGSDEDEEQHEQQQAAGHTAGQPKQTRQQQQQRWAAPILSQIQHSKLQLGGTAVTGSTAGAKQAVVPEVLQQQLLEATSNQRHLPSLHKLCLGVLGRHVTDLVEQLDGQLGWLPADVKAALLAVARRRGELTGAVLTALADAEWTQLDLAGCKRLYAADVLTAAHCMPNIRVLDVTGFEHLIAGGWRQLALAWTNLTMLRLGGTEAASKEALKALPHILPGLTAPAGVSAAAAPFSQCPADMMDRTTSSNGSSDEAGLDSWEDAWESDNEEDNGASINHSSSMQGGPRQQQQQEEQHSSRHTSSRLQAAPPSAADCRLKHLRVLVWPDVPQEAVELVQQRCPRVVINPVIKPDLVTGQLPPAEVDPYVPLDQPLMKLVGPEALQDIPQDSALRQPGMPIVHIADKFRAAYIQQAARLRDKERRLKKAEQRKQLRSSHALRTLNAWLDEPAYS